MDDDVKPQTQVILPNNEDHSSICSHYTFTLQKEAFQM